MKLIIASQDHKNQKFNLTKEGSDFGVNQIVLHALVGTLVKYGPSGKITPYLASSWDISEDKKNWRFKIREHLTADDGRKISAESFHSILLSSLKDYAQKGKIMGFDGLLGWDDFVKNKSQKIEGFTFDKDHVQFNFSKKPDEFFEILQMPYFGFWIENTKHEIISTSAYRLENNKGGELELSLREDWFNSQSNSFKSIHVSFGSTDPNQIDFSPYTIVQMPYESLTNNKIPNTYWVQGTPTIIETFVLSPYKEGFFRNRENRFFFQQRINQISSPLIESRFFYPTAPSSTTIKTNSTKSYSKDRVVEPIVFALERTNYQREEISKLKQIIELALKDSGLSFVILEKDDNDKDWFKKTDSNRYFDARISSVSIGATPILSAIKMMFCTTLGVSFPDFDNKICNLVEKYENDESDIDQIFIKEFNQTIIDQAIIIPIRHYSKKWLISNKISPTSFPATSPFLMFEKIEYE